MDQNVFDIQVGVAIAVCVADGSRGEGEGEGEAEAEAEVFYTGEWGTRASKEEWLNLFPESLPLDRFEVVPGSGLAPFYPEMEVNFASWPDLPSIFIKKFSGVETKRDKLVIAPTKDEVQRKITIFLNAPENQKEDIFHNTRDKTYQRAAETNFDPNLITPYAYRPLDNQFIYYHQSFIDYDRRNSLKPCWGSNNLSLASLKYRHGRGPVAFLQSVLPNRHVYGGHGAHIFPLWDKSTGAWSTHNFHPALLENLSSYWGRQITPEQLFAYCYGVIAWEGYSLRFAQELARSFPRVPFPRDHNLFQEGMELGQRLINWHSFQERYPGDGSLTIQGPATAIEKCDYDPQSRRLSLAAETYATPVSLDAWGYVVSGYEVLRQWVKRRGGLPLTLEIQRQLLDVIWAVEQTVNLRPALNDFGERLLAAPHFSIHELGLG